MSLVDRVQDRIMNQIENGISIIDLKVDLSDYINKDSISEESPTHKIKYNILGDVDCLLLQVPNINESGYYAGIVALKSYIDKFHPDLKVEIIDPVIDYFYLNPPDKNSPFFNMFNTYSNQGEYHLLYEYDETDILIKNFVFKYIENTNPAFIGFSIIDGNIDASLSIAKRIKETYPHIKILFGGNGIEILDFGVLPNLKYTTNEYFFIDVFARGDGEITFVELLKSDMTDESLSKIKGIVWRDLKGNLVHNSQRENIDMETLPFPNYSYLEENFYYKKHYSDHVPLVLSRGCPYRCTFCSVPEFIPQFRYRKLESVIDEMEHWINKGRTHFFCHDSIINGDPKWFKQFCEKIIEKGWGGGLISFGGNMRLQTPMRDLDTMRLYRKAGLIKMITGFESASEPVLKHMKKYSNMEGVREIFENVRIINSENEWPMLFAMQLIIGYLNETEEDFEKTLEFVREYKDCMSEILTCSGFLLHTTLKNKWVEEGNYLEFVSSVDFETNYNSSEQRLKRLVVIENFFDEIGISNSVYNRGLYYELNKSNREREPEIYNLPNKTLTYF